MYDACTQLVRWGEKRLFIYYNRIHSNKKLYWMHVSSYMHIHGRKGNIHFKYTSNPFYVYSHTHFCTFSHTLCITHIILESHTFIIGIHLLQNLLLLLQMAYYKMVYKPHWNNNGFHKLKVWQNIDIFCLTF